MPGAAGRAMSSQARTSSTTSANTTRSAVPRHCSTCRRSTSMRSPGRDAARLLDRVVTRDVARCSVGQVLYTCWCDGDGKVLDDGTIARLDETRFRMTRRRAQPALARRQRDRTGGRRSRTFGAHRCARAAGAERRAILEHATAGDLAALKYFRVMPCGLRGVPVRSRAPATRAISATRSGSRAAMRSGLGRAGRSRRAVRHHAGRHAGAGRRAHRGGPHLLDVDYVSAHKALIAGQTSSPFELDLGWTVNLEKGELRRQERARRRSSARAGVAARRCRGRLGLARARSTASVGTCAATAATAWRMSVPLYCGGRRSDTRRAAWWSPLLKKYIALAQSERRWAARRHARWKWR